jgi:hypothetical protein
MAENLETHLEKLYFFKHLLSVIVDIYEIGFTV